MELVTHPAQLFEKVDTSKIKELDAFAVGGAGEQNLGGGEQDVKAMEPGVIIGVPKEIKSSILSFFFD